jgi:hypothetical protein
MLLFFAWNGARELISGEQFIHPLSLFFDAQISSSPCAVEFVLKGTHLSGLGC